MKALIINKELTIPSKLLNFTAVRSSGAGGQNVNKVSSKVELRFDYNNLNLKEEVKERLLIKAKLDSQDNILVISQKTRKQSDNLQDAKDKLRVMILEALEEPILRVDTAPTIYSVEKRLSAKKNHSNIKKNRRFNED